MDPRFDKKFDAMLGRFRGHAHAQLGHHREAISAYDEVLRLDSESPKVLNGRGYSKAQIGDYDGAILDFTKSACLMTDKDTYYNRGYIKLQIGDYDGAIQDFNVAIDWDPTLTRAFRYRGKCKEQQGEYDAAILDYDQMKSSDQVGFFSPSRFYSLGCSYAKKGEYNVALYYFTKAEELGMFPQIEQAKAYEIQGKQELAQRYYQEVAQQDFNPIRKRYAQIKLEKMGWEVEEKFSDFSDATVEECIVLMLKALHQGDSALANQHGQKLLSIPFFLFQIPFYLEMDFMFAKEQIGLKLELKDGQEQENARVARRLQVLEREYVSYQNQYRDNNLQYRANSLLMDFNCATGEDKKNCFMMLLGESLLYHIPENDWLSLLQNLPIVTAAELNQCSPTIQFPAELAALIQTQAKNLEPSLNQNQRWRVLGLITALVRIQPDKEDQLTHDSEVLTSAVYQEARDSLLALVEKEKAVNRIAKEMFAHHSILKRDGRYAHFFQEAPQNKALHSPDESIRTQARLAFLR